MVGQMSWWDKCLFLIIGGTNVLVGQMTYFIIGGTKVAVGQMSYFIIGGTNVGVGKMSGGKKKDTFSKQCQYETAFPNLRNSTIFTSCLHYF